MLCRRLPWGLGGAVYLLVYLFAFVRLFVNVRSLMLSIGGQWMILNAVYLRRIIQVPNRGNNSGCYCEEVPSVVVFEISPSHLKTFYYRP